MTYFIYGDDLSKINEFIISYSSKNNFEKILIDLNDQNLSEILGTIETPNLFGDKNIFVVNVTDTDPEIVIKFADIVKDKNCDLIILFEDSIDQRGKVFKTLSKFKTQAFEIAKDNTIFIFTDYLLAKDMKRSFQELEKLSEKREDDLMIFNMIVSSFRSIASIKFNSKIQTKIPPFKIKQMTSYSEKFTEEEVKKIIKTLAENDLKFKIGEITSEMLVLHSMNTILQDRNLKE